MVRCWTTVRPSMPKNEVGTNHKNSTTRAVRGSRHAILHQIFSLFFIFNTYEHKKYLLSVGLRKDNCTQPHTCDRGFCPLLIQSQSSFLEDFCPSICMRQVFWLTPRPDVFPPFFGSDMVSGRWRALVNAQCHKSLQQRDCPGFAPDSLLIPLSRKPSYTVFFQNRLQR